MKLLLVFLFFILFVLFIRIDITINSLEYKYTQMRKNYFDYNITVSIILLHFVRILKISVRKDSITVNGIKIKAKLKNQNAQIIFKKIHTSREFLRKKVKDINLRIKYSTYDSKITATTFPFVILALNTIIYRNNLSRKYRSIEIIPLFNNNNSIEAILQAEISIKLFEIMPSKMNKKYNK